jgi:hypothetical protein
VLVRGCSHCSTACASGMRRASSDRQKARARSCVASRAELGVRGSDGQAHHEAGPLILTGVTAMSEFVARPSRMTPLVGSNQLRTLALTCRGTFSAYLAVTLSPCGSSSSADAMSPPLARSPPLLDSSWLVARHSVAARTMPAIRIR